MPSWKVYRRAIWPELGRHAILTTTSSGSTAATTLVCSGLINPNEEATRFEGMWVLGTQAPILGQQRAVLNSSGFAPTSGQVTVVSAFSTMVTSGVEFEVGSVMPAISTDENTSLLKITNDVLASQPPIDLLPITGVTTQVAYDLTTAYPWLTERSQIIGIYHQPTGLLRPVPWGGGWDWRYDADAPRLDIIGASFNTGDTFYLQVHRPASTWIKTAGVWGADTDGLNNDSDEALPLLNLVKASVLAECYRILGSRKGPDAYVQYYIDREKAWLKEAALLRWWDDQKTVEERRPTFSMVFSSAPLGTSRGYGV